MPIGILEDLLVIHRPGWPAPQCEDAGQHVWEFTAPSLFCVGCGAEVPMTDYQAVSRWWDYLAERVAPPMWN